MRSVEAIIERMIKAASVTNMAEMLKFCDFGRSSGSTWKKRKNIPEGSFARVANKTGCRVEWLKTGEGPMHSGEPEPLVPLLSKEHQQLLNAFDAAEPSIREAALTMLKNSAAKSQTSGQSGSSCVDQKLA